MRPGRGRARWLGTPYRHQASVKGEGADCLGLVRGVWRAVVGEEPETPPPYRPDWAERGGEETLLAAARRRLVEIPPAQARAGRRAAVPHERGRADQALRHPERRDGPERAGDPRLLGPVGGRELDGAVVAAAAGGGVHMAWRGEGRGDDREEE